MVRAYVLTPTLPSTLDIAGRTWEEHIRWMVELAGLEPVLVQDDTVLPDEPLVVLDGCFAAMTPRSLRILATGLPDSGASLAGRQGRITALASPGPGQAATVGSLLGGSIVTPLRALPPDERLAADDPGDLAALCRAIGNRHIATLESEGVHFVDPARTVVDTTVVIAPGCRIWPGTVLRGHTVLAEGVEVQAGAWLEDTLVAEGALIRPYSVCTGARIGVNARVGPFAHLRAGAVLGTKTRVGNFVEVKNTLLHDGAKSSHLTYLGDAEIGPRTNVGAGTITCNYDGFAKHRTTVGADAFIGSNTALVAPVSIGDGAIVGAGSTITTDVPAEGLAVTRAPQRNLPDKAPVIRARNQRRAKDRDDS